MTTQQAAAKILRHAVKMAKQDARQDAYRGKYLPDSRHFAYDEQGKHTQTSTWSNSAEQSIKESQASRVHGSQLDCGPCWQLDPAETREADHGH